MILIGPPGSGKTTFSQKLKSYKHIYPSDILRRELEKQTPRTLLYKEEIVSGKPGIPSEIIESIIAEEMEKIFTQDRDAKIIIDGFPRSIEQAKFLAPHLDSRNYVAVFMNIPREIILERIVLRRECPDCRKVYNLEFHPPKITEPPTCDHCQVFLIQRLADHEEQIRPRLARFDDWSLPVLDYYRSQGKLVYYPKK